MRRIVYPLLAIIVVVLVLLTRASLSPGLFLGQTASSDLIKGVIILNPVYKIASQKDVYCRDNNDARYLLVLDSSSRVIPTSVQELWGNYGEQGKQLNGKVAFPIFQKKTILNLWGLFDEN